MKENKHFLILYFTVTLFVSLVVLVAKAEATQQDPIFRITDAELDLIEKKSVNNSYYVYQYLKGDKQKTIDLCLDAQMRRPANSVLWAYILMMNFAQEKFEARTMSQSERKERYHSSLEYLTKYWKLFESFEKSNPEVQDIKATSERLRMDMALAALESGDLKTAEKLSKDLLKNKVDVKSPNFGDIIYDINVIQGRIALRQNRISNAKIFLLESGKSPGSAVLGSFGPSLILDRELLEKGEKEVVLEHLDQIRKFWGGKELDQWKKDIEEGKIPDDKRWH